jgi:ABC-type branched-subunit amino acid transport system substrate-binding protein
LLATDELRSIFGNAPGPSTKTTELTSSSNNSKMPEQVRSFTDRLAIAPTAPRATQPSSPTASVPAANGAPARLATVRGATEPAVRGLTDSEIRFGISAPFTGPAKELGQNMKLGIEAAFNVANASGGVYGRQLRLVAADDGYEPTRTMATNREPALGSTAYPRRIAQARV